MDFSLILMGCAIYAGLYEICKKKLQFMEFWQTFVAKISIRARIFGEIWGLIDHRPENI
jgi:hypothetical protein